MKTKRLLTVLLTVALAVVLLAVGVSAAEIVDSGTCGDNLTWTLDCEGTLTISGKGAMEDYDPHDENQDDEYEGYSAPWESMSDNVLQVVIERGVTGIGNYAFMDCRNMTSTTIPEGLTRIGSDAFSNCKNLTAVIIPDSVTNIEEGAFSGCVGLASVNIPKGVTHLSTLLFFNCRSLPEIIIPDTVASIGNGVFGYCSGLTEIVVPDSVTEIGVSVFRGCSNLTKVTLPGGIKEISGAMFDFCGNLTSVNIPESVTSIGMQAFSGCHSLTDLKIPAGVTEIGEVAFSGCSGLTSITIPEGVTVLPREGFKGCGMVSITIPAGVTEIGENAFSRCDNLQTITFTGNCPTFGPTPFAEVTATVYYPVDNETWTEDVMQDYDGDLTWVPKGKQKLKILEQPKNTYTKSGEVAKVTVKAQGNDLTYQWYIKNAGQKKYSKSSVTSATYSCRMNEKSKDRLAYCVISDSNGESVKTKTIILRQAASITTEPKNTYVKLGSTAKVSVKASGDGLKYQWYIKRPGGSKYEKSSVTSPTYSCTMTDKSKDRLLYCIVTDAYGKTVKSKTVILRMAATITQQPENTFAPNGEIVKVFVNAVGDDLKYRWYVKNAGDTEFTKSAATYATYSCRINEQSRGRQVYCVVTDGYGRTAVSDTVSVGCLLSITSQPQDVTVAEGQTARVSFQAEGDGLRYTWYFKNPGDDGFKKTSTFTGNTYSVKMDASRDGRWVYCIVSDAYGNALSTEMVRLRML